MQVNYAEPIPIPIPLPRLLCIDVKAEDIALSPLQSAPPPTLADLDNLLVNNPAPVCNTIKVADYTIVSHKLE